ncbi:hypothetical protein H0H93_016137, partial [Arthromyces matolae]
MIFKANLIQTVTIACILHVALAVPIPHGNSPVDQTTTSFPLISIPQSRDVASRAFEASLNLMTRSKSNLPVSPSPFKHEDLSIDQTLTPRNPVGDSSQQPGTGTANNSPAQRMPIEYRTLGFIANLTPPAIPDALEDALEKATFSISDEPLQKEWSQYLEKRKALQPFFTQVYCAAMNHVTMLRKNTINGDNESEIGRMARALLLDKGDTLDAEIRKAAQEY